MKKHVSGIKSMKSFVFMSTPKTYRIYIQYTYIVGKYKIYLYEL